MPRVRVRTTHHGGFGDAEIKAAVDQILCNKRSYSDVSKEYGIPPTTLKRYVKKVKLGDKSVTEISFQRTNDHLKIFSSEEEIMLVEYIKKSAKICYGLSSKSARRLAYQFAVANGKHLKENWLTEQHAGREWMMSFMKRHKLCLRTPQQMSLSRATSFNYHSVELFFKNLKEIRDRYKLEGQDIYNLDETATTTVHKPPKVVAEIGSKAVSKATSAERGVLVTMVAIIGATGRATPPYLIFPRVHFKEHMLHGAPAGTQGSCSPSGWISGEIFGNVIRHFVLHERPSKDKPKLLIFDNHESHISIDSIIYAKENGIIMLTLPPHTTHRLQPLDVSVFGPFKKYYYAACDRWMTNHPGKTISIYEIGQLIGESFPKAFTPINICSGFRATGIEPFNDIIFEDESFQTSAVTDRDYPEHAATSSQIDYANEPVITPPDKIRPYPKAGPRDPTRTKRRKCESAIITHTPIKMQIESERAARKAKILKKTERDQKKQIAAKKCLYKPNADDTCDDDNGVELIDTDDDMDEEQFSSDSDNNENQEMQLKVGFFIIVKVYRDNGGSFRNFISKINAIENGGVTVTFLKRHKSTTNFIITNETGFIQESEIVKKLASPVTPSIRRYNNMLVFNKDEIEGHSII